MLAVNPLIEVDVDVAFTVFQMLDDEVLYCTVYPVAPLTAVQLKVAPVCVMFELLRLAGAEQTEPVDPDVVKLALEEKAEQSAFTDQT